MHSWYTIRILLWCPLIQIGLHYVTKNLWEITHMKLESLVPLYNSLLQEVDVASRFWPLFLSREGHMPSCSFWKARLCVHMEGTWITFSNILPKHHLFRNLDYCLLKILYIYGLISGKTDLVWINISGKINTDSFELWCWRRLLRVPWTAKRTNQSILNEVSPEYSLEGLMMKLKLQYFSHLMRRTDSLEKTLMLGKIEGGRRRGKTEMRWLDGIIN